MRRQDQHPMTHFQVQLYLICLLWSSQHRENPVRPTKPPQNGPFTSTQTAEEAHQSIQLCHGSELSKVVLQFQTDFFEQ